MTNTSGPLYRRIRFGEEYWGYAKRQEELFNHIFDLTFAIMPPTEIGHLLGKLTGTDPGGAFETFGREIRARYRWPKVANITTPDGFFVSDSAIVSLELKFGAITSLDQLGKYLALFIHEERMTGRREHLLLHYVFPKDAENALAKYFGFAARDLAKQSPETIIGAADNRLVKDFLVENRSELEDVMGRVRLGASNWLEVSEQIALRIEELEGQGRDPTLARLLEGLHSAIQDHPLSGVPEK
ncbi:hypothetical protein E0K89_005520 [Aquicoccus sp. SCR17]|nr:hypothetical protein [Carideicomes alvinocaridis]